MAALLHAKLSVQCLGTRNVSLKTPVPQFRSVCGFGETTRRLALTTTAKPRPRQQQRGSPGIVRAAKPDTIIEDICQVGDHFLDTASNFLLRQIQKPLAKYIPDDWDPLDFLPINIQSNLQKSEAL